MLGFYNRVVVYLTDAARTTKHSLFRRIEVVAVRCGDIVLQTLENPSGYTKETQEPRIRSYA